MVNSIASRKYFLLLFPLFASTFSFAQAVQQLWATDTVLKIPASVLVDVKNERLFVSNIEGKGLWDKDRKGSISLVTLSGKVLNSQWVKGLHAPRGMALYQDILIVADVDSLVFIETTRATIVKKISIPDSKELNDVSMDKRGNVFVSDSKTKKIHLIGLTKLAVSDYLNGLDGPSGIALVEKTLYFLDGNSFYRLGKNKEKELVASGFDSSPIGIEAIDEETFLLSCLKGELWLVRENGEKKLLLDTKQDMINAADIGFDRRSKIVFIPTFYKNNVTAYQLK